MNRLLSYAPLQGVPEIRVDSVMVDGQHLPDAYVETPTRVLNVASIRSSSWNDVNVQVSLDVPWSEIAERKDIDGISVVFRIECYSTNVRQSAVVLVERGAPAVAALLMPRSQYAAAASIEAFVVAELSDRKQRDKLGRIVCIAPKWQVRFESTISEVNRKRRLNKKSGKRNLLEPEWVDFSDPPKGLAYLLPVKDEPYFVQISDDPPKLYLNEGITGYRLLLDDEERRRPASEAVLRNQEVRKLSVVGWSAMFNSAISAIEQGSDGQEPSAPKDWRGDVVSAIGQYMFPDLSALEVIRKLVAARDDESGSEMRSIQAALQTGIAHYIGEGRGLKKDLQRLLASGGLT